jgi:small GTP-binding protein
MARREAELDDQPDYTWKVTLVGNKHVGKTSISNRFVEDTFDEDQKSSSEVKYKRKNMPIAGTQAIAQLHIWDTLG